MLPLFSVVIPVYNGAETIRRTLDSLVHQPYDRFEVLLINDGSTDNTAAICEDYAERYPFIRLISVPNGGVAIARNVGIEHAQGTYLTFCDADDYYIDRAFDSALTDRLSAGTDDVLCCGFYLGDEAGNIVGSAAVPDEKKHIGNRAVQFPVNIRSICSVFYRREFIEHYHIRLKPGCRFTEDSCFVEIALYCADEVSFWNHPMYVYTFNRHSAMNRITDPIRWLYHAYEARLWEAEQMIERRSYGPESDAALRQMARVLADGAVLEMLESHFKAGGRVRTAVRELTALGLYEFVCTGDKSHLDSPIQARFAAFNRHPHRFAFFYQVRGWIIRTAKRVIPARFWVNQARGGTL